jgi:hypothetical protein
MGMIAQKRKELNSLAAQGRAFRESIAQLFFRHPFELHKVDVEAVRNLSDQLISCIERSKLLQREIEDLEG